MLCTVYKISDVIDSLKTNKESSSNDVKTKFLKIRKNVITPTFSSMIKACFLSGVFPSCPREAEIVPIYKKKVIQQKPRTIVRSLCYQSLIRLLKKHCATAF